MLRGMQPLLAEAYGSRRLQAVSAETDPVIPGADNNPFLAQMPTMDFEDFRVTVRFQSLSAQEAGNGACLCLQTGTQECFLAGKDCGISLESLRKDQPDLDLLLVEEGRFEEGRWKPGRRLNGDETAHLSLEQPGVLHVKFFTY